MRLLILIIFFASLTFAQIKSLDKIELKNEFTRALIERLGYKQQAEQTDSLINENYKLNQKIWLKDLDVAACAEEKFILSQKLLNFECSEQPFYENFAFGFLSSIFLILLIYGGIAIL